MPPSVPAGAAVRRRIVVAALVAVVVLVAVVAAVVLRDRAGEDGDRAGASPSPTTASPAPEPEPVSPFTGLPAPAGRPVLAVKIDNAPQARPHTGLEAADVVHVEPVEGGLSRLLAIFSSRLPDRVGPVRSAREADLDLLRQYGRPALAYSGANSGVLRLIRDAPVVDVSQARAGAGYRRSGDRRAPHNLYADPARLLRAAPDAGPAGDIGFRFGPAPEGGEVTVARTVRYAAARFGFTWADADRRWLVSMDGAPARTSGGERVSAATVVLQGTTISPSRFRDSLGNVTPFTETVGSGPVTVLRDGRAFTGRWSRPTAAAGTAYTTAAGAPLTFAPGPVWVVYHPAEG